MDTKFLPQFVFKDIQKVCLEEDEPIDKLEQILIYELGRFMCVLQIFCDEVDVNYFECIANDSLLHQLSEGRLFFLTQMQDASGTSSWISKLELLGPQRFRALFEFKKCMLELVSHSGTRIWAEKNIQLLQEYCIMNGLEINMLSDAMLLEANTAQNSHPMLMNQDLSYQKQAMPASTFMQGLSARPQPPTNAYGSQDSTKLGNQIQQSENSNYSNQGRRSISPSGLRSTSTSSYPAQPSAPRQSWISLTPGHQSSAASGGRDPEFEAKVRAIQNSFREFVNVEFEEWVLTAKKKYGHKPQLETNEALQIVIELLRKVGEKKLGFGVGPRN